MFVRNVNRWFVSLCLTIGVMLSIIPSALLAQTPESYAQMRFTRGRELFGEERYEEALVEFRESLSLSRSPNSRLYIARCLRQLGRLGESVAEYELTVAEALDRAATDPRYQRTAEAAQDELEAQRELVGWLTLHVEDPPENLRLSISGRDVPAAALGVPLPVDPGQLVVRAEAEGRVSIRQELAIAAGDRRDVTLELPPIPRAEPETEPAVPHGSAGRPTPEERRRGSGQVVGSGIGFGFGAVGAALFGIFGVMALHRRDELQESCGGDVCPVMYEDELEQGRLYQTVANVGLAVGAVGLTLGVVLLILELRHRRDNPRAARVHFLGDGMVVEW